MATVYLAEDLKHHRRVAIKVLRPELAATLGAERFSREIEVAARLQHPHILGVLDSGDADGFFYYVMPYVEGETLRDRLARSGELPVSEAVRLLSEVAEALSVAHRAGVVHRDIKPENVLLSGRHAMVMDFGVAKAVTEATGEHNLTSVGVALGTPSYMAPEQASADPQMDARVDIYAVGVMGYEMLTGHTPFPGLNPQQTLAAHVTQAPIPVGQQRAGLSPALDAVIMRCLAKRPADRFQTADELVTALEPLTALERRDHPDAHAAGAVARDRRPRGSPLARTPSPAPQRSRSSRRSSRGSPGPAPPRSRSTPNLVAVMPFRVAGADPSVQYLRQGMLDLLQAKLTGEGGPRAADTRSVLAAVRDAGGTDTQDLDGSAVASAREEDRRRPRAAGQHRGTGRSPRHQRRRCWRCRAAGPSRRPAWRARRTASSSSSTASPAQLLALGAGASQNQLSALTTTNLDALRAYLDGVTAYRRAAFQVATPLLEKAVSLDSTFALALSALIEADGWHLVDRRHEPRAPPRVAVSRSAQPAGPASFSPCASAPRIR